MSIVFVNVVVVDYVVVVVVSAAGQGVHHSIQSIYAR